MKKLLLILLALPFIGFGQQTYVPDDQFEAYLENNGMGNGIANDDSVTTANINTVDTLDIANSSLSNLIGIEDFTSLNFFIHYLYIKFSILSKIIIKFTDLNKYQQLILL